MAINESNAAVHAAAGAVEAVFNTGYLRIYSGTQPATADTALSGNTLLAELRFASTAFGTDTNGVASAAAISSVTAAATGTPTFFRALQSDGTTVIMDGTCAASGADLNLTGLSGGQIVSGGTVSISGFQYTQTK